MHVQWPGWGGLFVGGLAPAYFPYTRVLHCFTDLHSLRYRLRTWEAFASVTLHYVISTYILSVDLPLPFAGFLTDRWLRFVPFQSPTMTMAYM